MVRRIPLVAGIVLLLGVMSAAPAVSTELTDGAKGFISKLADEAIDKLTKTDLTPAQREDRFREIINEYADFKTVARWVLGRQYWSKASESQQKEYLSLFEDLMVVTYAGRFRDYGGETLDIKTVKPISDEEALVMSSLQRPNADKPVNIDWRVRGGGEKFRIIDIMIEGLSMAQTQRAEFSSFLRNNSGDIGALLKNLRGRIDAARAQPARS